MDLQRFAELKEIAENTEDSVDQNDNFNELLVEWYGSATSDEMMSLRTAVAPSGPAASTVVPGAVNSNRLREVYRAS